MATSGGGSNTEVKTHFTTREGVYTNLSQAEFCRMNRVPYSPQMGQVSAAPVKGSFVDIEDDEMNLTRIVFIVGKDLFYYDYEGIAQPVDYSQPLDKRVYKGVMPTCHDINEHTATLSNVTVAVGFAAGQIQIIDVGSRQSLQIFNEERMVEKTSATCVLWFPKSENLLMSSHNNGIIYTYDTSQKNMNVVPVFHDKPKKVSGDISIYTLKTKNYATQAGIPLGVLKNPVNKWVVTQDSSAVHEFKFSPDGKTIAIVSQDGYLRLVDLATFEKKGAMKSYFGGLLCCCWSPDGRYIVTGGEDDLVTVWSFYGSFVLARGHGHRSWVSNVAFDNFLCFVPEEDDVLSWYGSDSPSLIRTNTKSKITSNHYECEQTNLPGKKDLKSPVTKFQDMARRHRTDSTVSRKSNISIAESMDAPPRICYRFGSVGQDAQLCLWEITDDILFPRRRTVSMLRSHGCSHFIKPKTDPQSVANGIQQQRDSYHSDSSAVTISLTHLNSSDSKGKHARSNGSPAVVKDSAINLSRGFALFSSKDSHKDHSSNSMSEGKFATLAGGEHSEKKEHAKEHKRNLSMPYFGSKSSHKHQATLNGTVKADHGKLPKPPTLGTTLCPHLNETVMLDPLVCKTIAQSRLTWMSFRKDSFVAACQDGCLQIWARPQLSSTHIQQTTPPNDLPHRPLNSPTPTPKLSPSKSQADDEVNRQR